MSRFSVRLLISVCLFLTQSYAVEPSAEDIANLGNEATIVKGHLKSAETLVDDAEKKLKVARKKMAQLNRNLDDKKPVSQSEYNDAVSKLKIAEDEMTTANLKYKLYSDQIDKVLAKSRDMKSAQNEAIKQERADLERKLLRTDIDLLRGKFNKESLGREMDQLDIGRYVEAKMGLMINSNSMCRIASACAESKGQPLEIKDQVTPAQLEAEVFKGAKGNVFRSTNFMEASRATPTVTPARRSIK